jgi:hypothetical protein
LMQVQVPVLTIDTKWFQNVLHKNFKCGGVSIVRTDTCIGVVRLQITMVGGIWSAEIIARIRLATKLKITHIGMMISETIFGIRPYD